MLTLLLPLAVALVGVLLYALAANPKVAHIGEVLFAIGTLFVVWELSGKALHF
jgi:Na+/phosphate symporter